MKRSGLITALAVVQLLIGAVSLSIALYLLALMRSPEIANDQGALQGLRIASVSIAIFAVPTLISAIAIWQLRRWGQWLSITLYAMTVCALLYSPVIEHDPMDGSDITMTVIFVGLLIVFSLPQVGRQLRKSSQQ